MDDDRPKLKLTEVTDWKEIAKAAAQLPHHPLEVQVFAIVLCLLGETDDDADRVETFARALFPHVATTVLGRSVTLDELDDELDKLDQVELPADVRMVAGNPLFPSVRAAYECFWFGVTH